MTLLSDSEIDSRLDDLSGWETDYNKIWREFSFSDFVEAVEFTSDLVEPAEQDNHHPDLEVSWGKVVVNFTTHDEGGITNKDFELAQIINDLYTEDFAHE